MLNARSSTLYFDSLDINVGQLFKLSSILIIFTIIQNLGKRVGSLAIVVVKIVFSMSGVSIIPLQLKHEECVTMSNVIIMYIPWP